MNEEELESIPWSTLMDTGSNKNRLIYAVAGALIVFAVAAIVARTMWSPDVAQATTTTASPPVTTTTVVGPAAPTLLSEADLMATHDTETSRAAAAFAEWFVYDFFTVDGDPTTLVDLLDALPSGIAEELLPHSSNDAVTYVEWARATAVTESSPGIFDVLVLLRMVSAQPGEPFVRDAVRAVRLPMQVDSSGGFRLTDFPSTAQVPPRPQVPEWVEPVGPGAAAPNTYAVVQSWRDAEFVGMAAELAAGEWRMLYANTVAATTWPFLTTMPEDLIGP